MIVCVQEPELNTSPSYVLFNPSPRGIKTGSSTGRHSVGDVWISIFWNIPIFLYLFVKDWAWEEKKFGVLTDKAFLEQTKPVLTVLGITKHKLESKIMI